MKLNQAGISLIKHFEGLSLKAYKDLVGLNTIGYGHRTLMSIGTEITQEEAEKLLTADLSMTVSQLLPTIHVELNDNQFSAIICLAFNVGVSAIRNSTLIKLVNEKKFLEAADQFERWDHANGKVVPGLLARRVAEKTLFLS